MNHFNISIVPPIEKLVNKKNIEVRFIQSPEYLFDLLGDLPECTRIMQKGKYTLLDCVHGFNLSDKGLQRDLPHFKEHLKKDRMSWISWPRWKSGQETDLNRERIGESLQKEDLVEIKVDYHRLYLVCIEVFFQKEEQNLA